MFRQLLTIAAVACISVGANAATLWESEAAEGELVGWGKPCVAISAAEVAETITPGDFIKVTTVGVASDNQWPQVAIFGQYGGWPPLANEGVGNKEYPYVSSFPVTNELYESISADGLSVSGDGAYVGKVEIVSSGVEVGPNTVWFGNKVCGWGDGVSLPASLFADIAVGDKLALYTDGVGFQVLLGGWSGLNVPCYEFPDNVTYVDGVATYTMIEKYAENTVYEEGKDAINVFDLIKANGVIMHGTVTITRIDYIPATEEPQPSYILGHATTIPGREDEANIAPAADLQVYELEGNKVRINAWAGVEGYDLIAEYNEDWDLIGLTNVINGVEGDTYGEGWGYAYTGNGKEYVTVYISSGYAGAGSEDGEGYIWFQGYLNNTDFLYYYTGWPLTADELAEYIMEAYDEDIAQIQEWTEALAELQNTFPGYMAVEGAEQSLSSLAQAIHTCNGYVAAAIEAASESWGYTSPLTGELITSINEAIIGIVAERAELLAAIDNAAAADEETLNDYAEKLEDIFANGELSENGMDIAATITDILYQMGDAIAEASEKAINETAVYESPLTAEVIKNLDDLMIELKNSGINALGVDASSAVYYGIDGLQINNPVAGQVVIKVKNGKATKVYVK